MFEIATNTPLKPGDTVKLYFQRNSWFGIIDDALSALIEKNLRDNPQYEIMSWNITDDEAVYTVRIKEPPAGQVQQASIGGILAVIGISSLGALAFGWMLIKAEKVVATAIPLAAIVGVGVLLFWLRR